MSDTGWEYKVDIGIITGGKPDVDAIRKRLNENGKNGWELISVLSRNTTYEKEDWWLYKRPLIKKSKAGKTQKK